MAGSLSGAVCRAVRASGRGEWMGMRDSGESNGGGAKGEMSKSEGEDVGGCRNGAGRNEGAAIL